MTPTTPTNTFASEAREPAPEAPRKQTPPTKAPRHIDWSAVGCLVAAAVVLLGVFLGWRYITSLHPAKAKTKTTPTTTRTAPSPSPSPSQGQVVVVENAGSGTDAELQKMISADQARIQGDQAHVSFLQSILKRRAADRQQAKAAQEKQQAAVAAKKAAQEKARQARINELEKALAAEKAKR